MKAVDIYTDMGRFNIAAKHHQNVAEIYESEVADLDKAMHHYEQAADFFRVRRAKGREDFTPCKSSFFTCRFEF